MTDLNSNARRTINLHNFDKDMTTYSYISDFMNNDHLESFINKSTATNILPKKKKNIENRPKSSFMIKK